MLYNLKFNELEAVKFNVSIEDILILDYIFKNHNKFSTKTFNKEKYYWINYDEILDNLAILNIKKDTLYRKLRKLCKNGVLKHKLYRNNGTYSFYNLTDVFYKIFDCATSITNTSFNSMENNPAMSQNTIYDELLSTSIDNEIYPCNTDEFHYENIDSPNYRDRSSTDFDVFSILNDIKSTVVGLFKDSDGNKSLSKSIYNILNNILMLFNNIKSINRFYINTNNQKNNNKIYNNYTNTTTNTSSINGISYNLKKDLNPSNHEVYSYYCQNGFGSLTNYVVLTLDRLIENHDQFTVINAMEEAINKGNTRLCYVEGILKNWKNNKSNVVSNQIIPKASSKGTFNGFHQRNYDFDALEKELVANKFWED